MLFAFNLKYNQFIFCHVLPPIGALNAADTPAATPAVVKARLVKYSHVKRRNSVETMNKILFLVKYTHVRPSNSV